MKQLITRKSLLILLLLSLCAGTAMADKFRDQYLDEPPPEVLRHIQEKYPDGLLEDYIAINGATKGDYGFALVSQGNARTLLGYRREGDVMAYWLRNDNAVPQGDGYVFFNRHHPMGYICQWNSDETWGDDLGFSIVRIDKEHEEYYSQSISCHWENGTFRLFTYSDIDHSLEQAYVTGSNVSFYDPSTVQYMGRVSGTVQRDIRYVSFEALPKSYADAREKLTVAPDIPSGELAATSIKFTGGRKYEVYSAPSTASLRGGSGKAAVSTNDWIQVFGAEDGYILIQYAIDSGQMRFGYIDASALPEEAYVNTLYWRHTGATLKRRVSLTDDPLNSQKTLLSLESGSRVTLLGTMGDWAYVETTSGQWARGFVPLNAVEEERPDDSDDYGK